MNDDQDLDRSRPQLLDLLHTLQVCEDRESAMRAVMDMVAGMFQPGAICYLPEDGGRPLGDCGPWTSEARLLPNQMVKLLPSKKGFALAIKEKGVRVGMLCVDGVESPRSLDAKLSVLLIIPDALEIAFSNIRLLKELRDSQDRLAQLSKDNPLAVFNPGWDTKRLWLAAFAEKERTVKIEGYARDGEDVSELARRLGLSNYFTDVKLLPAAREVDAKTKVEVVKFQLQAKVRY